MSRSKNDIAWEKIFEKYCILDRLANNERVSISSAEVNDFREARLMTKFDHRSQLPELFAKHKLSILPLDFIHLLEYHLIVYSTSLYVRILWYCRL